MFLWTINQEGKKERHADLLWPSVYFACGLDEHFKLFITLRLLQPNHKAKNVSDEYKPDSVCPAFQISGLNKKPKSHHG